MKTIIILSGGFDPVHKGHVRMFQAAKEFSTHVIVGLNSDSWLKRKKGKPFMNWDERKEILKAFRFIDEVRSFNDSDNSACDLIRCIVDENKNNEVKIYFGNGGDRTSENSPEVDFCKENNIDILWELGGSKVQSSSSLIGNSKG